MLEPGLPDSPGADSSARACRLAVLATTLAVVASLFTAGAGWRPWSGQVLAVGLGLLPLLVPGWLHWQAFARPRAAWILAVLALSGLGGMMVLGSRCPGVGATLAWLAPAALAATSSAMAVRPPRTGGRIALAALWTALILLLWGGRQFDPFLASAALALLLLWRHGWRRSALVLVLLGTALLAWVIRDHPTAALRLVSYWIGDDPLGRNYIVHEARHAIVRAWPMGNPLLSERHSMPAALRRGYALANLAQALGWPGLLVVSGSLAWCYREFFRIARRHRATFKGELLHAFGLFLVVPAVAVLAHLVGLQPRALPVPLLSLEPALAALFLVAAGLAAELLGRKPSPSSGIRGRAGVRVAWLCLALAGMSLFASGQPGDGWIRLRRAGQGRAWLSHVYDAGGDCIALELRTRPGGPLIQRLDYPKQAVLAAFGSDCLDMGGPIRTWDFDFDGWNDLLVVGDASAQGNKTALVWLYHPGRRRFEFHPEFLHLTSPMPEPGSRRVLSFALIRGSTGENVTRVFAWSRGRLVLDWESCLIYDFASHRYLLERRTRRRDGTWRSRRWVLADPPA
jgi:cell division protein FtsW (lipid II flippase)